MKVTLIVFDLMMVEKCGTDLMWFADDESVRLFTYHAQ
jgi:hypothetical protein